MSLNVTDTVKSTFGSLKTETGMKVLGLMFAVQLVNMAASMMLEMGAMASVAGGVLTFAAAIAGIVITVGALRSFDTETISREQYTENLLWPVIRLTGANVVTTILAYGIAVVALLPAVLAAVALGAGTSVGTGALAGAGLPVALLGVAGFIAGIAAFLYIFLTLVVSMPMVAADDRRMFEALDKSIQRTKGSKFSMFLSILPIGVVYLIGVGIIIALAPSPGGSLSAPFAVAASVVSSLVAVLMYSLLNQYHQRLP
ncbi:MAG: hypothetical protein ACI9LV_000352 [Candidatus Nanohaloarchaea archaeon]|jgi:hypothetical protein